MQESVDYPHNSSVRDKPYVSRGVNNNNTLVNSTHYYDTIPEVLADHNYNNSSGPSDKLYAMVNKEQNEAYYSHALSEEIISEHSHNSRAIMGKERIKLQQNKAYSLTPNTTLSQTADIIYSSYYENDKIHGMIVEEHAYNPTSTEPLYHNTVFKGEANHIRLSGASRGESSTK